MFDAVFLKMRALPLPLHRYPCTVAAQSLVKSLLNTENSLSLHTLFSCTSGYQEGSKLTQKFHTCMQLVPYLMPLGQDGELLFWTEEAMALQAVALQDRECNC